MTCDVPRRLLAAIRALLRTLRGGSSRAARKRTWRASRARTSIPALQYRREAAASAQSSPATEEPLGAPSPPEKGQAVGRASGGCARLESDPEEEDLAPSSVADVPAQSTAADDAASPGYASADDDGLILPEQAAGTGDVNPPLPPALPSSGASIKSRLVLSKRLW